MKIIRARLKAFQGGKISEFISVKSRIKALIDKNVGENFDFVIDIKGRKSIKQFGPDNIDSELVGKELPIIDNTDLVLFKDDGTLTIINKENEGISPFYEGLPRQSSVDQLKRVRKLTKSVTIDDRVPKLKGSNLKHERNYIDSGIESYEDFERKNKSFVPNRNLKHLKSPFK